MSGYDGDAQALRAALAESATVLFERAVPVALRTGDKEERVEELTVRVSMGVSKHLHNGKVCFSVNAGITHRCSRGLSRAEPSTRRDTPEMLLERCDPLVSRAGLSIFRETWSTAAQTLQEQPQTASVLIWA